MNFDQIAAESQIGEPKAPVSTGFDGAGDVRLDFMRRDLRAFDRRAACVGDAAANAGIIDGFLSNEAVCQENSRNTAAQKCKHLKMHFLPDLCTKPRQRKLVDYAKREGGPRLRSAPAARRLGANPRVFGKTEDEKAAPAV